LQDLFLLIVYDLSYEKLIGGNKMIVTKDTIVGDVVMQDEGIAPILMASGLHCLGCAMASGETIEEACMVHGMDCDSLVEEINNYFQSQG
jgi:hybrid cluster-associated redox disulfide protein